MKFNLVPIGGQFSYQGQCYTKSGPIAACAEADGKSRMIPRSANVMLSNASEAYKDETTVEKVVSKLAVIQAVNDYHQQNLDCLELAAGEMAKETLADFKTKMNNVHQALVGRLNKM